MRYIALQDRFFCPFFKTSAHFPERTPVGWFYLGLLLSLPGQIYSLAQLQYFKLIICHFFQKLDSARFVISEGNDLFLDGSPHPIGFLVDFVHLLFVSFLIGAHLLQQDLCRSVESSSIQDYFWS